MEPDAFAGRREESAAPSPGTGLWERAREVIDERAARPATSDPATPHAAQAPRRTGEQPHPMESMRDGHPALRELLGGELFDAFAAAYLKAVPPPRASTPARLGERFAAHLEEHRPDRVLPAGRREPWIDLVIDLVRYERLFAEVHDGPGTEEEPPGAWPAEPPERVRAAPGVRLLRARAHVHRYHSAVRRGGRAAVPPPVPVRLVVFRRDYRVVTASPPPAAFVLLEVLLAGSPLDAASARAGMDAAAAGRQVRRWVAQRWIAPIPAGASGAPPVIRGSSADSRAD
ncbi:putative DNA-binding domain-containing protein [Actinomadura graeca]|uniref:DNA-binding domain-containing protein n=1 Tax=Actinomadura graeca TaxID=2750812 RepID=A0ABX8QNN6_9ACTN|nr:DNA-binding domain-containing protein [Actinomadura graeca]QXJ20251.1 putative DNA-binding domain-containing protein [Actinomadura graeca]